MSNVTDLPEEIRNLIDGDEWEDIKHMNTGTWLYVEDGEIKAAECEGACDE